MTEFGRSVAARQASQTGHRLRSAQDVLAFSKTAGDARLEAACARAIAVGDPSYRTIRASSPPALNAPASPNPPRRRPRPTYAALRC